MVLSTGVKNQTPSSLLGAVGSKRKLEDRADGLRPGAVRGSLDIPGRVTSLANLNGVNVALVHGPPQNSTLNLPQLDRLYFLERGFKEPIVITSDCGPLHYDPLVKPLSGGKGLS